MRFLDLDLDFFLNDNAYYSGSDSGRLGSKYKIWTVVKVRHFLERRCNLSHNNLVPGRTVETHDELIDFWHTLIESGVLRVPFEVIHIDAHPDLTVSSGLYETSGLLHIDSEHRLEILKRKDLHSGNYLTLAIAYGWIASLLWVPLHQTMEDLSQKYDNAGLGLVQFKGRKNRKSPKEDLSVVEWKSGVPFKILPWRKFRTSEPFDYMALSRSSSFTPPESDALIPVVEWYMRIV